MDSILTFSSFRFDWYLHQALLILLFPIPIESTTTNINIVTLYPKNVFMVCGLWDGCGETHCCVSSIQEREILWRQWLGTASSQWRRRTPVTASATTTMTPTQLYRSLRWQYCHMKCVPVMNARHGYEPRKSPCTSDHPSPHRRRRHHHHRLIRVRSLPNIDDPSRRYPFMATIKPSDLHHPWPPPFNTWCITFTFASFTNHHRSDPN